MWISTSPPGPSGSWVETTSTIQRPVEKAKSTDFDKVVKSLNAGKFNTVLGSIGFDDKGDVTAPGYVFYEWKNGQYDYLK